MMTAAQLKESRAAAAAVTGPRNPRWKHRGKTTTRQGYVLIRVGHEHPMTTTGWLREHRLVMAERIGRLLDPGEIVHHVNDVRDDNRAENLWLWPDDASHIVWHGMRRNGRELYVTMPAIRLAVAR